MIGLDSDALLERLDGDREPMAHLIDLFLQDAPDYLRSVQRSIAARDADGLHAAAHTLNGAAANLSANAVADAAKALECIARDGDLTGATVLSQTLHDAFDELVSQLRVA